MSRPRCTERGISILEVVIAMSLVAVGVLAILSLQPSAWRTVGKSDYLGRAGGILNEELERREALIMNPNNAVVVGTTATAVRSSGQAGTVPGDAVYTVTTVITRPDPAVEFWRVAVTVTWANQAANNYRNVQASIVVSRQNAFFF
jgi:Tfp pilus assembly protein PilV